MAAGRLAVAVWGSGLPWLCVGLGVCGVCLWRWLAAWGLAL